MVPHGLSRIFQHPKLNQSLLLKTFLKKLVLNVTTS
jgi:hypothetical protein